jgi:hypothetical protein
MLAADRSATSSRCWRHQGHDAVRVDPRAPADPCYLQGKFEQYDPLQQVASTSLHHMADLDEVLDKIGLC